MPIKRRAIRLACVRLSCACAAAAAAASIAACRAERPMQFRITLPKARHAGPADGRLLLLFSRDPKGEPRLEMREPRSQVSADRKADPVYQFFGVDVDGLEPGAAITVDPAAVGFPTDSLAELRPGDYTVQAVLNVYETFHRKDGHVVKLPPDHWEGQVWRTKPGNLYSDPRQVHVGRGSATIALSLDHEIPPLPPAKETQYLKYVRMPSRRLSEFWGRPVELGAWVLLPDGYDAHPAARYPLIVNPGHFTADFQAGQTRFLPDAPDPTLKGADRLTAEYGHKFYEEWTTGKLPRMLVINIQHANPYYDDSYAVNSANIGPYGDAITKELIPFVEARYRAIGAPWARTLTGCSTGGWEALALQVFYPDFFNGTWAGAPSPIDLRAYRLVNIYADRNAYWYDGPFARVPRPSVGRRGGTEIAPAERIEDDHVGMTMEQDNRAELVVGTRGRGAGLWDAMQAVFSPVGADGYPKPIWDKRTGAIDADVAEYWRDHYDISYILRRDWTELGPKLAGKIHLTVGTSDQYYLANAVRYVDAFLKSTKDPYYDGSVEFGDRFVHCFTGDPGQPLSVSRLTTLSRQMPVMAARMLKTAPPHADVKSWRY